MRTSTAVCRFFERELPRLLGADGVCLSEDVEVEFIVEGTGGGSWLICTDGRGRACVRPTCPGPKDCRVRAGADDFREILLGRLDPLRAFVQERVRVEGDVGLLLQLQACVLPRAA
ncbi:MAG: SCP2 sterol-binding domain-containing protein [Myxococcota bacterium]|nr:SCP2 sterol-binding domain-containing protein [Myxococcota bacterium]